MKLKPDKSEGSAWEKLEQEQEQQQQPQDSTHLAYQNGIDSVQEEEEKITIDYMAKDYTSFRNALLDLIPRKIPQWKDKSEADIGIMLIELFSYIADELSYFQDRVANEAFLRTARARSSVHNHLSLIDYRMHNGRSANAFIKVELKKKENNKKSAIIPAGFQISTYPERGRQGKEAASMIIFETLQDQLVDVAYNRIIVKKIHNSYDSMNPSAELEGRYPKLTKGQYVLLSKEEEDRLTKGIITQVVLVKLAEDSKIIDNYGGDAGNNTNNSTLITWEKSSNDEYRKLAYRGNARVFCCANILKASHGRTVRTEVLKQKEQKVSRFSFTVKEAPLTFTSDLDNGFIPMEARSTLKVWVNGELWEETDSLLKCGPLDQKYSISVDEDGYATIFFGDGKFGLKPEYGSLIEAQYRVGNGSVGNVGKDTLTQFDLPHNGRVLIEVEGGEGDELIENVTNPLPATGGIEMEAMDDAKIAGPKSLKALERAVTLKDYEDLVKREFQNEITNAKARFVYTGSWDTIFISVDVKGGQKIGIVDSKNNNNLFDRIRNYVNRVKMIGYDVRVEDVKYVPIEIAVTVYLEKYFDSETVRERIRNSLSNRDSIAVNGTKGFFHPDNFTFGEPVYASKIYEVLKNTSEVKYGIITTFRRRRNGSDDGNSSSLTDRNVNPSSVSIPSSSSSSRSADTSVKLRDEETKRNLELGYIPINENEIITIDHSGGEGRSYDTLLLHPENGILILDFARDNESKTDDNLDYEYIESDNSNSYSTS